MVDFKKELLAFRLQAGTGNIGYSVNILDIGFERIKAWKTTRTSKFEYESEVLLDLPYSKENEELARNKFPLEITHTYISMNHIPKNFKSSAPSGTAKKCFEGYFDKEISIEDYIL